MTQKINTGNIENKEVDTKLFLNRLFESRRFIVFVTIIITLTSSIFSLYKQPEFKSSLVIEVGQYNLYYDESLQKAAIASQMRQKLKTLYQSSYSLNLLIESQSLLIEDLITQFIHKKDFEIEFFNLEFTPTSNRLIKIDTTSNSVKNNENTLNQIFSYILNKHKNITDDSDSYIANKVQEQISILEQTNAYYSQLEQDTEKAILTRNQTNIDELEKLLLDVDDQVVKDYLNRLIIDTRYLTSSSNSFTLKTKVFEHSKEIYKLKNNLKLIDTRLKSDSKIVGEIQSEKLNYFSYYLIFGFIFGLTFSIAIVLIANSLKGLKNNN
jgi:hypothetical protein